MTIGHHDHDATAAGDVGDMLESLRYTHTKLLDALQKLAVATRSEERSTLLRRIDGYVSREREIEAEIIPLVDDPGLEGAIEDMRRLDHAIDRDLARLGAIAPDRPEFDVGVHMLHGDIELRIAWERETIEPAWEAALSPRTLRLRRAAR